MTTITGRKVRADAKLEQLNEAQRELLHFWFVEHWSYHEVAKLVREQFGISVGRSTLSAYYRRHVLSVQQEDEAEIVAELAALPAGDFDGATLRRAKALLWSALATINPDVDLAAKLSRIIDKAERRALAAKRVELEERKVVVREKLAALREAAEERRRAKAGVETTKHTKRHERVGESAGVAGRGEGAEVAAKAQSCEGRSEGAEGAEGAVNLAAAVNSAASMTGETMGAKISSGEGGGSPRFSGYSEVGRGGAEGDLGAAPRSPCEVNAGAGTQSGSENRTHPPTELETTKDTKGHEKVGESAFVAGRGEGAEVAAKALSCEDRSEGAEGGKAEKREIGKMGNGSERPSELKNEQPKLPRFPGYSALSGAGVEVRRDDAQPKVSAGSASDLVRPLTQREEELDTMSLIRLIRQRAEFREQEMRAMEADMAKDGR